MRITLLRQKQFSQENARVTWTLRFALGIIHGDRSDRKKKQIFYSSKTSFSVVEFSNTVTFWRNARFNVILPSVQIIKQV